MDFGDIFKNFGQDFGFGQQKQRTRQQRFTNFGSGDGDDAFARAERLFKKMFEEGGFDDMDDNDEFLNNF